MQVCTHGWRNTEKFMSYFQYEGKYWKCKNRKRYEEVNKPNKESRLTS